MEISGGIEAKRSLFNIGSLLLFGMFIILFSFLLGFVSIHRFVNYPISIPSPSPSLYLGPYGIQAVYTLVPESSVTVHTPVQTALTTDKYIPKPII